MTTLRTLRRFFGHAVIVLSFLTLLVPSAMATHLRGGTITWVESSTSGPQYTIKFTFQYSQRWSYPNNPGLCTPTPCLAVGANVLISTLSGAGFFNFGDGTPNSDASGIVTSVNQAEDWLTATFTFSHTYQGGGPYTAYFFDSNRISTLKLGHDEPEYIWTTVSNYANGAPVASVPAFIAVPLQSIVTFNLGSAVTDIDPNVHLSFRLATFAETYGPLSLSGITTVPCPSNIAYLQGGLPSAQPPGLSISSTGVVTWNTALIQPAISSGNCGFGVPAPADLWSTQVIVSALDTNGNLKASIPIDVILKFVTLVGDLPTLTLNPTGTQTVQTGTPVSFTATGSSANTGAKITLNATGVPVGATASNLNATLTPPVHSTFSWTPTSSQPGTYVVTYVATDNNFQQASASKTIVVAAAPPTATCSAAISVAYGQTGTLSASVFDPNNELLNVAWTLDGNAVQTNSGVVAFPTAATVNLIQNYGAVGSHSIVATATDPHGVTASCTTSATVTKANQTITFAALPDVPFGTADFAVSATASSGLGVSFAAVGSCSIALTTLHLTGVGSCQVTASQAGDTNNNAAANVTQSFNVLAAVVTATAGSGSSTYDGTAKSPSACVVSGTFTGDVTCANNPATVGPDAGTTTITPAVSSSNLGNYTITAVNGSYTIAKANSVTTVSCPMSVNYNGAAQTPCTATVTGGGGFTQVLTPTVTYTNNSNAGTANATASFVGNTNNNASSGNATFSIAKVPLTATAGGYSGGYDGSAHALSACSVSTNFDAITCTNSPAGPVGPHAGSAVVTPTVVGVTSNYNVTITNGAWSITQAASVVTVTCPPSLVYNGSAQTPCSAAVTGAGGLNQAISPVVYTNNVNAGTASASASFAGDTDHTASTNSATFVIAAAPSVVAVTCPATVPYNGSAQTPCTATATGVGGLNATVPVTYSPIFAGPGAVTASATFGGDSNHSGSSGSGGFTITQAPTTTAVTCTPSVTYTGSTQTPCTAAVTGPGLNTTAVVSYSNNTNAGAATATASYPGSSLYAASSGSGMFTIAKAASVVAITCPTSVTYTGSALTPCTATVTGAGGLSQSVTVTYTNNTVGTATATASFAGDANHTSTTVSKTFTILYSTGACLGSAGHTILQPINADGSSVWKAGSTVPAKFRVCDASGNSISATVVKSFYLATIISGTVVTTPDETPDSTTPDTTFRWSPAPDSQWIFNINTKGLMANATYIYQITLNDGSVIQFQYGLK